MGSCQGLYAAVGVLLALLLRATEGTAAYSSHQTSEHVDDWDTLGAHDQTQKTQDIPVPDFMTLGQKYSVAIGSTIVLPCRINETETSSNFVLAWKRDIAVLTAGTVKVTRNSRIRLLSAAQRSHQFLRSHGGMAAPISAPSSSSPSASSSASSAVSFERGSYNLEIQNVRANDAGLYVCQIGAIIPREIVHSLEVLVPPKINYLVPSTKLEVTKGASIKLECKATGNPEPVISWSRKNNVMPNGEANITNNVLEMMHADRHTMGLYRCTADNRVGQPDQRDVYVMVLFAPEIEMEHSVMHTGMGCETQLVCIVHSEPPSKVIWYKDNRQLGSTDHHSHQTRGNRNTLHLRNVSRDDLGNYSCQASNSYGNNRATIMVTAMPSECQFVDSSRISNYPDQYNISWTVQSFEPLLEFRLFHRRQRNDSKRVHYSQRPPHESNYLSAYPHQYPAGGSSTLYGGDPADDESEWEPIIVTPAAAAGRSIGDIYGQSSSTSSGVGHLSAQYANFGGQLSSFPMTGGSSSSSSGRGTSSSVGTAMHVSGSNGQHRTSYLLTNLRPASNYEVRVQALNAFGWGKLSTTFHFATPAFEADDRRNPNGANFRPLTQQTSSTATSTASGAVTIAKSTICLTAGALSLLMAGSYGAAALHRN